MKTTISKFSVNIRPESDDRKVKAFLSTSKENGNIYVDISLRDNYGMLIEDRMELDEKDFDEIPNLSFDVEKDDEREDLVFTVKNRTGKRYGYLVKNSDEGIIVDRQEEEEIESIGHIWWQDINPDKIKVGNVEIYDIDWDTTSLSPDDSETILKMRVRYEDERYLFEASVRRCIRYENDPESEEVEWWDVDERGYIDITKALDKSNGADILTSENRRELENIFYIDIVEAIDNSPFFYKDEEELSELAKTLNTSVNMVIEEGLVSSPKTDKVKKRKNRSSGIKV